MSSVDPKFAERTLFPCLKKSERNFIRNLAIENRFTFQELREVCQISKDLEQWNEGSVAHWWEGKNEKEKIKGKNEKLKILREWVEKLKSEPQEYSMSLRSNPVPPKLHFEKEKSEKKIYGRCPVYSEETVCCNLKTIDAVENCGFGCNYCTIQTFYGDKVTFDAELGRKLKEIPIDPEKFYHFGTGQSSDSLIWGNRNGILDDLCGFAADHPNILLEFKTKSRNISYFLENTIPHNVVISWSLNPDVVIRNEENFTASLEDRLKAARRVADKNIRVSFHFHPMIYYGSVEKRVVPAATLLPHPDQGQPPWQQLKRPPLIFQQTHDAGWEKDYPDLANRVQKIFAPEEVLFISFGSVTFIKPVLKAIRERGWNTKIHQMPFVKDPKGKLTYPDEIKIEMFQTMFKAFSPWREKVFFYLCMEKSAIWQETFRFVYPNNTLFEADFAKKTMPKLY